MSSDPAWETTRLLAGTFETAALTYHQARPDYPDALFEDLSRVAALPAGARLLEVGCGTGKATIPLARRGFEIVALEPGERLAAQAVQNLAGFADVSVLTRPFEDWQPAGDAKFDLVYAATSWHWLDPETRYRRAWEALRPGGHLALWSATHVFPDDGDPFFRDLQPVYDSIGEGLPPGDHRPRPGELPSKEAEIMGTGLFTDVQVRHHDWEVRYDAESYLALLQTFSGHLAMDEWKQERLYSEITHRLADRPDGRLRRHWGVALHVSTRRDD